MDPKQALEALKELEDVPAEVIEALEGSSLRKQLSEMETRWREEAEPAINFKARQETLPKRKEALKRVGVDYDTEKPYGQKTLDSIPAEDLADLDKVAAFVKAEGFEATIKAEEQGGERSGAEVITEFVSSAGDGDQPRTNKNAEYEAERDAAAKESPEALRAVLAKHGQLADD